MLRNRSRFFAWIGLVAVAAVGLLASAHGVAAAAPPNLVGNFYGSSRSDRPGSGALSMQIEVESQRKRHSRVSVFAVDQPEFQGSGALLPDGVGLKMNTRAMGEKAPRLVPTATTDGTTIWGTYSLKRHGDLPDDTGTFSVAR
jgi:hypothetical protein